MVWLYYSVLGKKKKKEKPSYSASCIPDGLYPTSTLDLQEDKEDCVSSLKIQG